MVSFFNKLINSSFLCSALFFLVKTARKQFVKCRVQIFFDGCHGSQSGGGIAAGVVNGSSMARRDWVQTL
jgi:hypothetical protein